MPRDTANVPRSSLPRRLCREPEALQRCVKGRRRLQVRHVAAVFHENPFGTARQRTRQRTLLGAPRPLPRTQADQSSTRCVLARRRCPVVLCRVRAAVPCTLCTLQTEPPCVRSVSCRGGDGRRPVAARSHASSTRVAGAHMASLVTAQPAEPPSPTGVAPERETRGVRPTTVVGFCLPALVATIFLRSRDYPPFSTFSPSSSETPPVTGFRAAHRRRRRHQPRMHAFARDGLDALGGGVRDGLDALGEGLGGGVRDGLSSHGKELGNGLVGGSLRLGLCILAAAVVVAVVLRQPVNVPTFGAGK